MYHIEISNSSGLVEFRVDLKGPALDKNQKKAEELMAGLNAFLDLLKGLEREVM